MLTNIYTDASYSVEDELGGYAFFIDSVNHCGFGALKATSATQAELIGIYMALCAVVINDVSGAVIIHTDSLHSAMMVANRDRTYNSYPIMKKIRDVINQNKIYYHINYIPRNSTLEMLWCDVTAKNQWMEK